MEESKFKVLHALYEWKKRKSKYRVPNKPEISYIVHKTAGDLRPKVVHS